MGTSSARRAPTTWSWRRAKAAAGKYLASAGAGLEAREVVARYLAALSEDAVAAAQPLMAAFPLTRKAAQNLGAFSQAAAQGWKQALEDQGLTPAAGAAGEGFALALAAALGESAGSLEAAAARSSLAAILQDPGFGGQVSTAEIVTKFLAEALYQRLVLDLGEPLEAAGEDFGHWRHGLRDLRAYIAAAAAKAGKLPAPANWHGLAGWTWVTRCLEQIIEQANSPGKTENRLSHG